MKWILYERCVLHFVSKADMLSFFYSSRGTERCQTYGFQLTDENQAIFMG